MEGEGSAWAIVDSLLDKMEEMEKETQIDYIYIQLTPEMDKIGRRQKAGIDLK